MKITEIVTIAIGGATHDHGWPAAPIRTCNTTRWSKFAQTKDSPGWELLHHSRTGRRRSGTVAAPLDWRIGPGA